MSHPATPREMPAVFVGGPKDGEHYHRDVGPGTDSIAFARDEGPSHRYEFVEERDGEAVFRYLGTGPATASHVADCRWILTTNAECEYRATHRYCPHPEHACTCPKGCPG